MNLFAQATNAPNNGASNAEDFQPLTRNPQTTGGGLQPGKGPQSTTSQDILSKENARIIVPVSDGQPGETKAATTTAAGGINWFLVVAVAAIMVVALEYFFRRRERASKLAPARSVPTETIEYPVEEPEPVVPEAAEVPEGILEPHPTPVEPKQTKPKKKKSSKSKSKRKKSKK